MDQLGKMTLGKIFKSLSYKDLESGDQETFL